MDWGYLNPGQLCNLHLPRLFKGLRVIAAALTPLSLTPRPRIATRGARARAGAGLASPPIRSQSPEPRRPGARTWQPITDLSGRACGGGGVGGAWGLRRRSPLGLRLGSALGRCASGRLGTAADGAGCDLLLPGISQVLRSFSAHLSVTSLKKGSLFQSLLYPQYLDQYLAYGRLTKYFLILKFLTNTLLMLLPALFSVRG
ncbi:uncharacterized protein LOC125281895 [Ursus arctos]|uniref:uncharacterized protein LOC125281895 n=1 Tax=Ursus arctos TaxID=9644 RepID=UPI0020170784|nr:uncharacterized protein LOC125281895 [Ursus arctos]